MKLTFRSRLPSRHRNHLTSLCRVVLPHQLLPRTLSERGPPSISRTWPTWTPAIIWHGPIRHAPLAPAGPSPAPAEPAQASAPAGSPADHQPAAAAVQRPPAGARRPLSVYVRQLRPPEHVQGPVRSTPLQHRAAPAPSPIPCAQPFLGLTRVSVPRAPASSRPVTRAQTGSLPPPPDRLTLSATHASPLPANYRSTLADPNWRV